MRNKTTKPQQQQASSSSSVSSSPRLKKRRGFKKWINIGNGEPLGTILEPSNKKSEYTRGSSDNTTSVTHIKTPEYREIGVQTSFDYPATSDNSGNDNNICNKQSIIVITSSPVDHKCNDIEIQDLNDPPSIAIPDKTTDDGTSMKNNNLPLGDNVNTISPVIIEDRMISDLSTAINRSIVACVAVDRNGIDDDSSIHSDSSTEASYSVSDRNAWQKSYKSESNVVDDEPVPTSVITTTPHVVVCGDMVGTIEVSHRRLPSYKDDDNNDDRDDTDLNEDAVVPDEETKEVPPTSDNAAACEGDENVIETIPKTESHGNTVASRSVNSKPDERIDDNNDDNASCRQESSLDQMLRAIDDGNEDDTRCDMSSCNQASEGSSAVGSIGTKSTADTKSTAGTKYTSATKSTIGTKYTSATKSTVGTKSTIGTKSTVGTKSTTTSKQMKSSTLDQEIPLTMETFIEAHKEGYEYANYKSKKLWKKWFSPKKASQ